jgi:repressor LexA
MLTERQEEILDFVRQFQRAQGVPPSTREIARHFQLSQSTAMGHLQALANKVQIEKLADGKWGLRAREVQAQLFDLPVYGSIPAGLPAMQEQEPDETIPIDPALFGVKRPRPHRLWGLAVRGDSMIGAHIVDGDIGVFVRQEARTGDIVAALVDDTDVTLKRLAQVRGRTVLRAENPRFADIVPSRSLEVQGVLVGLIRRQR